MAQVKTTIMILSRNEFLIFRGTRVARWWSVSLQLVVSDEYRKSKLLGNYAEGLKQRETDRLIDSENES